MKLYLKVAYTCRCFAGLPRSDSGRFQCYPSLHQSPFSPIYVYRGLVEKELDHLVSEGILEPVEFTEWAWPIIVPMLKSIRICGVFKKTINPVSSLDCYPIPKVENLFSSLSKGKVFSKIDLSQAYQQVSLEVKSCQYTVINMHKGLFRYTRLPFGVSSAAGVFHRVMVSLLQGLTGVIVYIDDILMASSTEEEHLKKLYDVLAQLEKGGLRAHKSKCHFLVLSVSLHGHRVDSDGLNPLSDKVEAVLKAPAPQNLRELKSYLGFLSYYQGRRSQSGYGLTTFHTQAISFLAIVASLQRIIP